MHTEVGLRTGEKEGCDSIHYWKFLITLLLVTSSNLVFCQYSFINITKIYVGRKLLLPGPSLPVHGSIMYRRREIVEMNILGTIMTSLTLGQGHQFSHEKNQISRRLQTHDKNYCLLSLSQSGLQKQLDHVALWFCRVERVVRVNGGNFERII